jgi:hypothetical protein
MTDGAAWGWAIIAGIATVVIPVFTAPEPRPPDNGDGGDAAEPGRATNRKHGINEKQKY